MDMKVPQLKASGKWFYCGKNAYKRILITKQKLRKRVSLEGMGLWRTGKSGLRCFQSLSFLIFHALTTWTRIFGPHLNFMTWWVILFFPSWMQHDSCVSKFNSSCFGCLEYLFTETCVGWEQFSLGHQARYGLSCPWGKKPGRDGLIGPWN